MSFQDQDGGEVSEDEVNRLSSIEEREAERVMGKDQGDFFDPFQNAYSEKDFDTVYENAHQEQVDIQSNLFILLYLLFRSTLGSGPR